MTQPNNAYIIVEDSKNLDEGTATESKNPLHDTSEEASQRMLDSQGIFIEPTVHFPETTEPIEELSEELRSAGGIELVAGDETPDEY